MRSEWLSEWGERVDRVPWRRAEMHLSTAMGECVHLAVAGAAAGGNLVGE